MVAPYNNGSDGSAPIAVEGADVEVAARPLTGLALLLHEFATNAAKYGALSVPTGRVRVQIAVDGEDLRLTWVEQGGPAIAGEPESRGFGTSLERGVIAGQLQGRIKREWDASGLTIHLAIPLRALA
jgi:two-component sensor histidine kinase